MSTEEMQQKLARVLYYCNLQYKHDGSYRRKQFDDDV